MPYGKPEEYEKMGMDKKKASKLSKMKMPAGKREEMVEDELGLEDEMGSDELDLAMAEPMDGEEGAPMGDLAGASDEDLIAEMKKRGIRPEDLEAPEEAEELDQESLEEA